MADEETNEAEVICMPCRGTGSVISNLGGSPSTVECPWCRGSGRRSEDIDAQAHWRQEGDETAAAAAGEDADQEPPDDAA
jgi:DnaJ-class molecular chaperone